MSSVVVLLILALAVTQIPDKPSEPPRSARAAASNARDTPLPPRFFAPDSFWNTRLEPSTVPTWDSATVARRLADQARYSNRSTPVTGFYAPGHGVLIVESAWSVPIYTVPAGQPRTRVTWVGRSGKPVSPASGSGLQSYFDSVPVPTGVGQLQADAGDGHLVIYSPSTDEMWEFWRFAATATGYTARYGGYIPHVSESSGVLPNRWGARATSLALAGGVIRMSDYLAGVIPHALAISIPVIAAGYVPPATRGDGPAAAVRGGDSRDAVPEGARFRLPADFNCSDGLGPNPTKLLTMICVAARDYGLVVVDKSGGTINMYAEDDRTVGTPYQSVSVSPWPAIDRQFSGREGILNQFPWESLQYLG